MFSFVFQNGSKVEVARYIPKLTLLKNNVFVFRNQMGGVSTLVDGKITDLTNQPDAEFEIYGNTVLVKLFNKSYIVFKNGRKYTT
jgi:hypothetical protein